MWHHSDASRREIAEACSCVHISPVVARLDRAIQYSETLMTCRDMTEYWILRLRKV